MTQLKLPKDESNREYNMKYLYCLLILAALGACQDENETVYSVAPELTPYVEAFYAEASQSGKLSPRTWWLN